VSAAIGAKDTFSVSQDISIVGIFGNYWDGAAMAQTIRAGVIGFGLGGRIFHAPFLHAIDGFELAAILERHGDAAAQAYPGVAIARTLEELLALSDLSLVVVTTPPATHYELARQCLEAGKHVVIDKPFTATSEQGRELIELARAHNLVLSAYQNRRWDGDFLTLQQLIDAGELGRLVTLESRFERYHPGLRAKPWQERNEPGNGIVHDLGAHLVDQALVLFGTPETVQADVRHDRDQTAVNDAFAIHLHYPRLRVSLYSTMLARVPGPRFVAHGTNGSYVKYGLDPQEQALKDGAVLGGPHWGEEPESAWGTLTTTENGVPVARLVPTLPGDYRLYYENVRDAILGRAPLAVPGEQGLRVIRLLELAFESSERKCAVSCEPLDETL
jgi:scyllo-inositol 2-dehydrogenase (NADP+)